jgi:site-specific recombinase XerD
MTTNALVTVDQEDVQLVEAWLHDKATTTQRAYRRFAWNMLTDLGKAVRMLTAMDVQQYAMSLTGEAGKLAYNINALKSLFTYATELGYIPVNLGKLLKPPKVRDKLSQRILSEVDVIRMIDRTENKRDHALLRLLYHAGLRVSEVVGLKWEDVRETSDGAVLDVWGKGDKQRYVPISKSMYDELRGLVGAHLGSDRYVFQSRKGKAGTQPMDTRQVERIVLDAAKRAGIDGNVSPHWLRHSNATHATRNKAPLSVVKESLGHASLVTTSRYLHVEPGEGTSQYLKV